MKYFVPKDTPCMILLKLDHSAKIVALTKVNVLIDTKDIIRSGNQIGWNDLPNKVSYWIFEKDATKLQ